MEEKREECGVVGIYSKTKKDVAPLLYRALIALQHRGQDAAGFAVFDGKKINERRGLGFVENIFRKEDLRLGGSVGIGHTRYPTIGDCRVEDVQPSVYEDVAVAHNGHLANYAEVKKKIEEWGYKFNSTVDSEPMAYYIHKFGMEDGVKRIMADFEGAYSDAAICKGGLYVFRDPFGIRPLIWGENKDFIMFASESVALDINDIEYGGDVGNGLLVNAATGERKTINRKERKNCMFEYVYFSRPDSTINDRGVREVRMKLGETLAAEAPVSCDIVVPVPDTSRTAAMGYAIRLGAAYDEGLIKNRYIGRTFIMPTQEKRREAVRLKLNPMKDVTRGKRVVLIDDSIVRGTTMREIVSLVRNAGGAKEVHVRITSPPVKWPCFYGVDIPTRSELIASSKSIEEIRKFIGADSLAYLSLEGLRKAVGIPICDGCLTGNYHTEYVKKLARAAK
ncbi:amidophosphoribosyltransferase [Candidatus Micrarchaeota archaeon]|nr:amidophosphoribosyltransferase [Candidatus Micrarchaeota archaeon]